MGTCNVIKLVIVILTIGTATGCQNLSSLRNSSAGTENLNQELGYIAQSENQLTDKKRSLFRGSDQFFSNASPGTIKKLDKSLWGESTEIAISDSYFSASGRNCHRIKIKTNIPNQNIDRIVCQTISDYWVSVRAITQENISGP